MGSRETEERDERKEEAKTMDDFFRTENDQRKKNLDLYLNIEHEIDTSNYQL